MVDVLAKEYGKLPSEILKNADTFDMLVYDVSTTYQEYKRKKAKNEPADVSMYDKQQMNELSKQYYGKDVL